MILIITSSFDETVKYMLGGNDEFRNQSFRLDVDRLQNYEINVTGIDWSISFGNVTVYSKEIDSIYYRKPTFPNISEYEPVYQYMIQKDIIALINGIVDSFEGIVISKPHILRMAENKTFQLIYAGKNGWLIPDSYIGNSNRVCSIRNGDCNIIKPLSTGMIEKDGIVTVFHTNMFSKCLEDVSLTPIYLQEYVEKKYEVRLTVVGDSFYAVRIDTEDKVDWRRDYEHHKYHVIECPDAIKEKCHKMLTDFNLSFAAFDFIVTPDEQWVFLELNPNGQWLWLEKSLNLDISIKIMEILMNVQKNSC